MYALKWSPLKHKSTKLNWSSMTLSRKIGAYVRRLYTRKDPNPRLYTCKDHFTGWSTCESFAIARDTSPYMLSLFNRYKNNWFGCTLQVMTRPFSTRLKVFTWLMQLHFFPTCVFSAMSSSIYYLSGRWIFGDIICKIWLTFDVLKMGSLEIHYCLLTVACQHSTQPILNM